MKYFVEYKNNATKKTKLVPLTKLGEKFVDTYAEKEIDKLTRLSIIKEIETNYLAEEIDLSQFTFHMVSEDMSQVI